MNKDKTKTVWLWGSKGGQVGLDKDNIKYLCSEWVLTQKGTKIMLDPNKWPCNRFALVNGCV